MPRARIVEIKSSLSLEIGKEALKEFEIPVADRGIRFKDNMQWPDQYVVTWIDALHFKIANWVHPMGLSPRDYGEDEFWEVEISGDAAQPVFKASAKHPVNFKNNILISSWYWFWPAPFQSVESSFRNPSSSWAGLFYLLFFSSEPLFLRMKQLFVFDTSKDF